MYVENTIFAAFSSVKRQKITFLGMQVKFDRVTYQISIFQQLLRLH